MVLLTIKPSGQEPFANLCTPYKAGMAGWTYKVEIWTANDDTGNVGNFGKRYYSWAMPVYKDDGGDYITFENCHLKSILGKFYIKDLVVTESNEVEMPTTTGVRERQYTIC